MILVAAMLFAAPVSMGPDVDAWRACVTSETVRLGRDNTESAQTVMEVAAAKCHDERRRVELVIEGTKLIAGARVAAEQEKRFMDAAKAEAFEALLEARAKR